MNTAANARDSVDRLLAIMARLRDAHRGCPWDRRQTFESIAPYTIEEAYEVADVIARGELSELADELGDLLFQVAFHARMAEERGLFDFRDVTDAIVDKMIRRHPHVFGDEPIRSVAEQNEAWEAHKRAEREAKAGAGSRMDHVARGLPALKRALKLQKKAAEVGFDWDGAQEVLPKVTEELGELANAIESDSCTDSIAAELGDLMFACVNLARHLEIEPDSALRNANTKFERRFRRMEALAVARGSSLESADADGLNTLWEETKREET